MCGPSDMKHVLSVAKRTCVVPSWALPTRLSQRDVLLYGLGECVLDRVRGAMCTAGWWQQTCAPPVGTSGALLGYLSNLCKLLTPVHCMHALSRIGMMCWLLHRAARFFDKQPLLGGARVPSGKCQPCRSATRRVPGYAVNSSRADPLGVVENLTSPSLTTTSMCIPFCRAMGERAAPEEKPTWWLKEAVKLRALREKLDPDDTGTVWGTFVCACGTCQPEL